MGESNQKRDKAEKERRFSQEQYEMLLRCSEKKDISEWNEWREEHPDKNVLLQQAPLEHAWLVGANLEGAKLRLANLQGANLEHANLQEVRLWRANLQDADLRGANLKHARLSGANLQHTRLGGANLQASTLQGANLRLARAWRANLQGTRLTGVKLHGANFSRVIVDGSTLIWDCEVNRYRKDKFSTNFEGVGLHSVRIDPRTKQLLEYNIRRMNWGKWYKEHWLLKWLVKLFWLMSDYGRSTGRIILSFFVLAAVFALVYWLWPGCLIVRGEVGYIRGLVHALYFSVVTMTTLGFGDIAANPDSWGGQVLLMVQVILGYVLLGALVTRFAVLFTAGGPAGKFAKRAKVDAGGHYEAEKK